MRFVGQRAVEAGVTALGVEEQLVCIKLIDDVLLFLVGVGLNHVAAHVLIVCRVFHVFKLYSNGATVTTFGIVGLENVLDADQTLISFDFAIVGASVLLSSVHVAHRVVAIVESQLLRVANFN